MNLEEYRAFCLSLPFTDEYLPFDQHTLAFRVGGPAGKIFALISLEKTPVFTNLKCDPDKAEELREAYPQIKPGYHMNKKMWNSVYIEDGLSNKLIRNLVQESYNLVYQSLTSKLRKELEQNS